MGKPPVNPGFTGGLAVKLQIYAQPVDNLFGLQNTV